MPQDILNLIKTIHNMFPFLEQTEILKLAIRAYKLAEENVFRASENLIQKN